MKEKRKNMTRAELADYVRSCIDAEQQKGRKSAERFASAILKQLSQGKIRVQSDKKIIVNFWLRSEYPSDDLVRDILAEYGYELEELHYGAVSYRWSVIVNLNQG